MEREQRNKAQREEEKVCRFWLHNLPGVGDKAIHKLLKHFGSAGEIYRKDAGELKQVLKEKTALKVEEFCKTFDAPRAYEAMRAKGIEFYTVDEPEFPSRLKKLSCPPYGIYCLGNLPEDQRPAAAVIGARECSEYGNYMAEAFAGELGRAGISVISGMARGIDGIAQGAALKEGGRTYAVLGCGADICYPASNRRLYEEILKGGGGILSVFPPGTMPVKQQFPERNRIVAGLSDLVLVVEARQKSGTWITVDMALEQGKNVYAVPGRLTDRLSDGCNLLIRQGAGIALSPADMIAELAVLGNRREWGMPKGAQENQEEGDVLRFLDYMPRSVDEILEAMHKAGKKTELAELFEELIDLCIMGRARQVSGNYFAKQGK